MTKTILHPVSKELKKALEEAQDYTFPEIMETPEGEEKALRYVVWVDEYSRIPSYKKLIKEAGLEEYTQEILSKAHLVYDDGMLHITVLI